MPLTKRRKERWIAALESGDYAQTYSTMRSEDVPGKPRYCAIGVLIADEMGRDFNPHTTEGMRAFKKRFSRYFGKFSRSYVVTDDYWGAFGLNPTEGSRIMRMNDRSHLDFPTIANWIRENIKTK